MDAAMEDIEDAEEEMQAVEMHDEEDAEFVQDMDGAEGPGHGAEAGAGEDEVLAPGDGSSDDGGSGVSCVRPFTV